MEKENETDLTDEALSALPDRELDALVAQRIFRHALIPRSVAVEKEGCITLSEGAEIGLGGVLDLESGYFEGDGQFITQYPDDPLHSRIYEIPRYATDISAAFLMEERIAELGLAEAYGTVLGDIVSESDSMIQHGSNYALAHAGPRQRCLAALRACQKD